MGKTTYFALLASAGLALSLSACAERTANLPTSKGAVHKTAAWVKTKPAVTASVSERECLARAMYFESNRSSTEGMLAVGSVVMNRVESGRYGNSICNVVGAPRQFAPGVLSRSMADRSAPVVREVADQVLAGQRHVQVKQAMHFHMAGLKFSYPNMHYVTVAGGNAFYEKRDRNFYNAAPVMMASAQPPVQTLAFNQQPTTQNYRSGSVITDLTGTAQVADTSVEPVQVAENIPVGSGVVEKPAVAALLAPLPPPRPKMLGLTVSPDKRAAAEATFRVADNIPVANRTR